MKQNIGGVDRVLRIVLGAVILAAGYMAKDLWLAILGAAVALTGLFGWCGLYTVLKVNTAKKAKAKKPVAKKAKAKKKK